MSRLAAFTIILVALLALAATGCGGTTIDQDPGQDASPAGKDSQGLAALVAQTVQKTYRVTYNVSRTDGDLTSEGTFTYYFMPPKVRFDTNITSSGQSLVARSFFLEGTTIDCERQQPMERWLCTSMDAPALAPEQRVPAEALARLDEHNVTRAQVANVAGNSACFLLTPKSADSGLPDETTVCLDEAGTLVYLQTRGPGLDRSFTAQAEDVSEAVSESDFDPPTEPIRR